MLKNQNKIILTAVLVGIIAFISGCNVLYPPVDDTPVKVVKLKDKTAEATIAKQYIGNMLKKLDVYLSKKDSNSLQAIMDMFGPTGKIDVIGADGLIPGETDWFTSRLKIRDLFLVEYVMFFNDFNFDEKNTKISVKGDVAWLSTTGTMAYNIDHDKSYTDLLKYIKKNIKNDSTKHTNYVKDMLGFLSELLFVKGKGTDQYVLPLRCTAVAVKENDKWLFYQMCFSFPVDAKVIGSVFSL